MPRRKKEGVKKAREKKVKAPKKSPVRVNTGEGRPVNDEHIVNLRREEALAQIENIEKTEREKSWIIWSGVTFFMLVIGIIWIFNLKMVFKATPKDNSNMDLDKISEDFSRVIEEAKEGIKEIKEVSKDSSASTTPADISDTASSTPVGAIGNPAMTATSTNESEEVDLEELRKKIEELEKKLQTNN